jgi:amino acid adenylation domain-containing protein
MADSGRVPPVLSLNFNFAPSLQASMARVLREDGSESLASIFIAAFAVVRFRDLPGEVVRLHLKLPSGPRRVEIPISADQRLVDVLKLVETLLDSTALPELEPSPAEWTLSFSDADALTGQGALSAVLTESTGWDVAVATSSDSLIVPSFWFERYSTVLAHLLENPEQILSSFLLLSKEEQNWYENKWSSGTRSIPFVSLPQRLTEDARLRPEHSVLVAPNGGLTLAQLDAKVRGVAQRLALAGVEPGSLVAVCLPPSVELLPAILGIFRVAAVYVPLDPTHPKTRIHTILEEIKPQVVITTDELVGGLELHAWQTWSVDVDPIAEALDLGTAFRDADCKVGPETPAYIFYTSGTTGSPKGVVATHGNLQFYLESAKNRYGFTPSDVFCSIARSTFSISLFDLLSPIYCGASLRLLDRATIVDPGALRKALQDVTVLHAGPALLKALVRHIEAFPEPRTGLDHLHHLSMGGDLVPPDLVERLKRYTGRAELFIIYGCTEVSCMGLTYPISRDVRVTRSLVGKPFPNVEVRVVDDQLRRVPVGVRGEIIFAGLGITSGYFLRPDLTEARYIELDGQRWYRTGDVGRFHPCGNIEILGREDFQIQLGGIRIELGEVESVLKRAPGVRDAVVAARVPPGLEDPILVGYLVMGDEPLDVERVRRFALAELPDYMVPGAFMQLEALPLNINLKLDRNALPDLLPVTTDTSQAEGEAEILVLEAMAEALGSGKIDLDEALANLGCSSLVLLSFGSRILMRAGIQIPLGHLFAPGTTLRDLARLLNALQVNGEGGRKQIQLQRAPDRCPLSLSQARIWFADVVQGQGLAYGVPLVFELAPDLDNEALSRAIRHLYQRHATLRTIVTADGAELYQGLLDDVAPPLEVVSIERGALDGALADRQARPFDLSRGPLVRAVLFETAGEPSVLLFHFHHLVFDEFSSRILQRELTALYLAEATGRAAALPELPISFADYSYSERQHWSSGAWNADLEYFRERFRTSPSPLDLPTDRPRTGSQSRVGGSVVGRLDGEDLPKLRQLARARGSSLFVLGVAAWGALMQRHSGQDEVVIGTAVANRLRPEAEKLIGCFINLVPLRISVEIEQSIEGFLEAARTTCLEAIEHSAVPFEEIVRIAGMDRGGAGAELFRTLVIFEEQVALESNGLIAGVKRPPLPGALTDLALWLVDRGDHLELALSYDASLFDQETAQLYVQQLEAGLRYLASGASDVVGKWGFISRVEQEQLSTWNRSTSKPVRPGSFLDWIREQALQAPERRAVMCSQGALSYRELLESVAAIQVILRDAGVKPGSLVGVSVPRTRDLLVATLAVLYSGCGYVPLDPAYPEDRLRHMVEDSGLDVVLCRGAVSRLPESVRCIDLDTTNTSPSSISAGPVNPESVAYVIYTSGSTGLPKGVQVPHRAVDNFIEAMAFEPGIRPHDVLVSVTTLSFDISVLELFLPLSQGNQIVIADEEQVRDGDALGRLITSSGATMLQATPSTWKMLRNAGVNLPPGFRAIIGGEPLPRDLAEELLSAGIELWNAYGPTETTVWSSCEHVTDSSRITVGRPIQNTSFYVLNPAGQRQPIGAPGELYIGGTGVTLGYLNRDDLTSERFVEDPFLEAPLGKMYQTGDRIRLLHDGRYEHLGRLDGQIKLRGHRIELGEIESVVRRLGLAEDCVAFVHDHSSNDQRLVLFVQGESLPDMAELRLQLSKHLPSYMLPQHIAPIDQIPRTANGKLNRKELPAASIQDATESQDDFLGTPVERHVLEIFRKVLGNTAIGMDSDFFEHGGHSLMVVSLASMISNSFGIEFPIGQIFQNSSPRQIAYAIQNMEELQPKPVLLSGAEHAPPVFFLLGVHLYKDIATHLEKSFSNYGVYSRSDIEVTDKNNNIKSVESLAKDYIELIRLKQKNGPYRLCGASFGGILAYEVAQQLTQVGEKVDLLMLFDSEPPMTYMAKIQCHIRSIRVGNFQKPLKQMAKLSLEQIYNLLRKVESKQAVKADQTLENIRKFAYIASAMDYASRMKPYAGDVHLVVATEEKSYTGASKCRWKKLAKNHSVTYVQGNHLGILKEKNAEIIAEVIQNYLSEK